MTSLRRARASWLLLALLGALASPAVDAATRTELRVPVVTVGRITNITATRSSEAFLRFSEDVSLREMTSRIEGGGRVAGYALTNRTQGRKEGDFLVQSFVFNRCREPGCPSAEQPLYVRTAEGLVNGVIPAGTYRLYVVADSAPVRITFRDRHLRGRYALQLAPARIDAEIRTLPMSPTSTVDGTIFSAGAFTSLEPGRGIGMLGLWALGPTYGGGAFGDCFYFDRTLAPRAESAFLPGCPTGFAPSRHVQPPSVPGGEGGVIYKSTHHTVPVGIGGWAASAAAIEDFGAVALWLRF